MRRRHFGHFLNFELRRNHCAHVVLVRVVIFLRLKGHGQVLDELLRQFLFLVFQLDPVRRR